MTPITVRDVALQVQAEAAAGEIRLLPLEAQHVNRLAIDETVITEAATGREMRTLRGRLGELGDGTDYVWEHFRRALVLLRLRGAAGPAFFVACPREVTP